MVASQLIKDHYQPVIQGIAKAYGIKLLPNPSAVVSATGGFPEVVQHTAWYVGGDGDTRPHYRYRRYLEVLEQHIPVADGPLTHIDVGCGAGLFSWVLLDWVARHEIGFDQVGLYGIDHCPAMIRLAQMVTRRLSQRILDYPEAHYCQDPNVLLRQLEEQHSNDTNYIVTFGHVLVQANTPQNISAFAEIVAQIAKLMNARSRCALVAVDAQGRPVDLRSSWDLLLSSLAEYGKKCEQRLVAPTAINDNDRAKFAWLSRES